MPETNHPRKARNEWLQQLCHCRRIDTLEKVIDNTRHKLSNDAPQNFNAAADHRLTEITMSKFSTRFPRQCGSLSGSVSPWSQPIISFLNTPNLFGMNFIRSLFMKIHPLGLLLATILVGCAPHTRTTDCADAYVYTDGLIADSAGTLNLAQNTLNQTGVNHVHPTSPTAAIKPATLHRLTAPSPPRRTPNPLTGHSPRLLTRQ